MLKSKVEKLGREDLGQEVSKQEVLAMERDHLCGVTMDKWRAAGGVDVTTIRDVFTGHYVYEHVRRSMYFIFPDGKLMACSRARLEGLEMCPQTGVWGARRSTTLSGKLHDTHEPVIKIVAYAFCQSTRRNATDSIKVRFTEPQGGPESPLKERASNVFFWHRPSCEHCGQNLPKEPGPQTFERVDYIDTTYGGKKRVRLGTEVTEDMLRAAEASRTYESTYKRTPPSDRLRGPSYLPQPLNGGLVPATPYEIVFGDTAGNLSKKDPLE